ncbi:iron ABC transporter permease [uncultured Phascolarctobacterium sp.]|nr:iron ABC transporter permease [uncultured Phascolarctobacterium sp.]
MNLFSRKYAVITFLVCCIILVYLLGQGTIEIGYKKTCQILADIIQGTMSDTDILADVIYYLRLPRFALAVLIGSGLAVSGCVMQAVMKNPLADPYLLGISSGAGLGAVLAIILGLTSVMGFDSIGFFAFIGALTVTICIILIAFYFGSANTVTILLSGMAFNAVSAACISLIISVYADAERIQSVTFWLMGSLQNARWENIYVLTIVVFCLMFYFYKNSRILNLMLFGDEAAITLGYDLAKIRMVYVFLCAVMVGLIVYNSGIIGFIGLVVPHIVRLIYRSNYKQILPNCALTGAVFMVLADVISRIAREGSEVPIGIVVSVIGAPVFVYLLLSKNYGYNKK